MTLRGRWARGNNWTLVLEAVSNSDIPGRGIGGISWNQGFGVVSNIDPRAEALVGVDGIRNLREQIVMVRLQAGAC